ncbi:DUF397 domain-containing protein [Streptomyces sp. IB201691-2A2]|uniref:DUF397 domain-containing protein n=1 Tax=Streptomyces sp. IB201691-2A2 TaxID=2561920 RepID=UPI00117EBFB4|nr:DUF397 domain-containing protein [Streptomyces sp. IB201691-2A2]TRO69713.1 DUF397 domain-containing protein [Streptomyces sp. IB201691-2A2]
MSELNWFKSSYSDSGGGDCVEAAFTWRRSSYSDSSGGDCVEVATTSAIHIRDSKDIARPSLHVSPAAWGVFIAEVRNSPQS